MSIYIIGDLHLSFNDDKPMNIFGQNWEKHTNKIKEDWTKKVKMQDTVILAGDFSWAMKLEDAYKDFEYINNLPGKKILLKGNHDYWWTTVTNMKEYLKDKKINNIEFLHNNSFNIENKIIVGTRGWSLQESENANKMIKREAQRLELSIKDGIDKYGNDKEIICIMHYPPILNIEDSSKFLEIIEKYNIKRCYYGHLHGTSHKDAVEGNVKGIDFNLISADYLDFKLKLIDI